MPDWFDRPVSLASDEETGTLSLAEKTALAGGALVGGLLTATSVLNRYHRRELTRPGGIPKALDAPTASLPLREGSANYYHRPGEGTPIVLLHSFNAAASSFEMKPLFDDLTEATDRPIYALDWFGFGLSDRPDIRYHPELYLRQLRHFLSEKVGDEADVIGLSLSCEYAAGVAATFPMLIRKMVLIAPTSMTSKRRRHQWIGPIVRLASATGTFELFFHQLTERSNLHRFYAQQIFPGGLTVPSELTNYAYVTSHVIGAHHAPRYFVDGSLFMNGGARRTYQRMQVPTLLIPPMSSAGTIQDFNKLPELLAANPNVRAAPVGRSLMPHWEQPETLNNVLQLFL